MPGNDDDNSFDNAYAPSAPRAASPPAAAGADNDIGAHDPTSMPELRAQAAGLVRENRALREEVAGLRQFIESMRQLARAAETPVVDADVISLLDDVLGHAMSAIGARDGSLLALDEDTGELVFVVARGEAGKGLLWRRLPPGEGIAGWVAENRRATIVNEATLDERFYRNLDRELQFKTRSVLAAPLVGGGSVLGVVELLNKRQGDLPNEELFNKSDETLLSLFCQFAGEMLHSVVDGAANSEHNEFAGDSNDEWGKTSDATPTSP